MQRAPSPRPNDGCEGDYRNRAYIDAVVVCFFYVLKWSKYWKLMGVFFLFCYPVILEKPIRIPRSLSVKAASVLKGFLNKVSVANEP